MRSIPSTMATTTRRGVLSLILPVLPEPLATQDEQGTPTPEPSTAATAQATAPATTAPAASPSAGAQSTAAQSGLMTLTAAPGLLLSIPAEAYTCAPVTYDDGMWQVTYSTESQALSVVVEYYPAGAKSAASILAAEQAALAGQGITATPGTTTLTNGTAVSTLAWSASAIPPWAQDDTAASAPITASGIFADGPGGASYAVHALYDGARQTTSQLASTITASMEVSAA